MSQDVTNQKPEVDVFFYSSDKQERFLERVEGTINNTDKAWQVVLDFLSNYPHFKMYYHRVLMQGDKTPKQIIWDVGSHSEFFIVREVVPGTKKPRKAKLRNVKKQKEQVEQLKEEEDNGR